MEYSFKKKILKISLLAIVLSSFFTFVIYFFLYSFYKKNEVIEIEDILLDNFTIKVDKKYEKDTIDYYKILDNVEKHLLSSSIESDVFKFNTCNKASFDYDNSILCDLLETCQNTFYCSNKIYAPVKNNANFDTILFDRTTIKKLKDNVILNLDQYINPYCIHEISKNFLEEGINNFFIQRYNDITVHGDQNSAIKGWNLVKKIKLLPQNDYINNFEDEAQDIEESEKIDNDENDDKEDEEENLKRRIQYVRDNCTNEYLANLIIDRETQLKKNISNVENIVEEKKVEESLKNEEKYINVKFKNIKNKSISVIDGNEINKIKKVKYAFCGNHKDDSYDLHEFYMNAKTGITSDPNFLVLFVIADNQLIAKSFSNAIVCDNFENTDEIIEKLRYNDCQYFVLFFDEENVLQYRNSIDLRVKNDNDNYEVSYYE